MALQEVHTGFTFGFDRGKLQAIQGGVTRAKSNLTRIAASTDAFQQRMGSFFERAKGVIGTYLGFRAVRAITSDYAQGADAIAKFSSGLGISAQEYQKLNFAAGLSGVTMEELNMALPKFAKSAADAADGSKAMADAFSRAGLKLQGGKFLGDPIEMMQAFADGLKNVKDPIRKAQILQNSFGRAGKKMGVLMAQGSEGIKKAMAEAEKYGHVLSDTQLKAAEQYNDEMLRVKSIMIGIRNTIASKVLPVFTKQLMAFRKWWVEGRNAERAMRALKLIAFFTALVIGRMVTGAVIRNIKAFTTGIWAMVRGLRAANAASTLLALKITAIFVAIGLVVLLIDDLVAFAQGRDSLIGRILGDSHLATKLRDALKGMAKAAKEAWAEIGPALAAAWKEAKPAVNDLWRAIEPLIGPAFRFGIEQIISGIKTLTFVVKNLAKAMTFMIGVFKGMVPAAKVVLGVLGAIMNAITGIENASNAAKRAMEKLTGKTIKVSKAGVDDLVKQLDRQLAPGTTSTGGQVVHGLFPSQPASVFAGGMSTMPPGPLPIPFPFAARGFAGPGQAPGFGVPIGLQQAARNTTNNNVGQGAVQVTVNASGNPKQIGAEVNRQVKKGISKAVTGASRDIQRPPSGQR